MAGLAYANSDQGGQALLNNNDVVLLRLGLSMPGTYLVFGRVMVANGDGDAQAASARSCIRDGSDLVDRADVRIPGDASQTIHLQGTARVDAGRAELVDIRCSTFRGYAGESSLLAIQVDELRLD